MLRSDVNDVMVDCCLRGGPAHGRGPVCGPSLSRGRRPTVPSMALGGAPQYFAIFQNNSTATKTWS